jgi:glycosyltransferase involved in cell wall biosynthesis
MKILIDGQTLSTPELHRGIGEVFLQVLNDIIRLGYYHRFFLCVYDDFDKESLRDISGNVEFLSLGRKIDTSELGRKSYTITILQYVAENEIDCFWIPNPVMPNVNFIKKSPECRVIVTVHDLIPLIFKKFYLNTWPAEIKKEYLERLNYLNSIADFILPVSNSTKNDLNYYLKIKPEKMRTIYEGLKKNIYDNPAKFSDRSFSKYILYVGGFDPRKNMEKSVIAFRHLVETYNHSDLKYIIVCNSDQGTKEQFLNFVAEQKLSGKVWLTGYLSESELETYYKNAELLFFPSLYEGFGLPVADALAAGLPVVVSNRSSLPEIAGEAGIFFDPENSEDMAEKLHQVLSDPLLKTTMREKSIRISMRYSWKNMAEQYIEVFESRPPTKPDPDNDCGLMQKKLLKIAYFSPLHPQVSGISQYSKELLSELHKYATIDLFVDNDIIPSDHEIKENFRYFRYIQFDTLVKTEKYDAILYHIGNNTLHEYIYKTSLRYPGIIVLHDYVIHPFIRRVTYECGKLFTYLAEIFAVNPKKRWSLLFQILKQGMNSVDVIQYPLNDRIIKHSQCVIVHSQYARKLLKDYNNVYVIPQGCYAIDYSDEEKLKNKVFMKFNPDEILISVFGFMNRNKKIELLADTFKKLQADFPQIRLIIVGEIDGALKKHILEISEQIRITGYIPEKEYSQYLMISDIIVNLRYPTMGETSKTLLDAMGWGKPVIVTNIGSYKETPDNCCWKLDVDAFEEEILYQFLHELIVNTNLRKSMGESGRKFIREQNNWKDIAMQYVKLIESM